MMTTTLVPPRENLSFSALRHFSATSSYFAHFFGTNNDITSAEIEEETKRLLADHPNLSKSLFSPNRTFLEYLPFINPFIRGFNPNLLLNEEFAGKAPLSHHSSAYKTVMCEAWLLNAYCGYGKSCRFAHGLGELQKREITKKDEAKYQTKICLKYTTHGVCCHGPACLFLHPLPENPKLFLAPILAAENGISPLKDETTREYYLMSRSFYMENHNFEDPYDSETIQPTSINESSSYDGTTKLLDLVFDENGNIIQHIITSKSSSDISR